MSPRTPLTRDRVLRAAIELADRNGLDALTMRRLGAELGVQAMSLYKHVASKDEILDGVVEIIFGQIEVPEVGADWKQAMSQRAHSARKVLAQHSWALGLLESRGARGPATQNYLDAILGTLRTAGFSPADAGHAFWLLDSYVYGHVIQEASLSPSGPHGPGAADPTGGPPAPAFPHLAEMASSAGGSTHSIDGEFAYGLDLILAGLERAVAPLEMHKRTTPLPGTPSLPLAAEEIE